MYQYRVWNLESGLCEDSNATGKEPDEAFDAWRVDRCRHVFNSDSDLVGKRFLVAKITPGSGCNHNHFGVFCVRPVSEPKYVTEKVTL